MALNTATILNALRSHAASLGVFEHVVGHALTNPPHTGVAIAFEFGRFRRSRSSGLAATSGLITYGASIYRPMRTEPQDDIEVEILGAADALMNAYSGDFELGGNVRCVDLLGQESDGLGADGGYAKVGDVPYRAITVNIPLLVNDVFEQAG